jgi:hypothetical protein
VPAGRVVHLKVLQVQGRRREEIEIADMVVVQMRNHHVLDRARIAAEKSQSLGRTTNVIPLSLGGHGCRKTGIDDDFAALAANQPDEVIERHRAVVRVATDKVLGFAPRVMRVLDRVDLVLRRAHVILIRAIFSLPT